MEFVSSIIEPRRKILTGQTVGEERRSFNRAVGRARQRKGVRTTSTQQKPNVVFLLADNLGWGEVRLSGLNAQMRRVFEMAGFGEFLDLSGTRQEALEGW